MYWLLSNRHDGCNRYHPCFFICAMYICVVPVVDTRHIIPAGKLCGQVSDCLTFTYVGAYNYGCRAVQSIPEQSRND